MHGLKVLFRARTEAVSRGQFILKRSMSGDIC